MNGPGVATLSAQAVDYCVEARGLKPVKPVVLQVDVVDYLGNLTQTFVIVQTESLSIVSNVQSSP
jgi:hypothetical protein